MSDFISVGEGKVALVLNDDGLTVTLSEAQCDGSIKASELRFDQEGYQRLLGAMVTLQGAVGSRLGRIPSVFTPSANPFAIRFPGSMSVDDFDFSDHGNDNEEDED
jgi:hypothetical protein